MPLEPHDLLPPEEDRHRPASATGALFRMATSSDAAASSATLGYIIDPNRDRLIQFARFPEWLERRTGNRLHRSATYRWRQRGVRAEDGTIIRLPTIRIGGVRYTSEEAFAWWTAAIDGAPAAAAAAHAAAVAADSEDTETLKRAGVI